MTQPLDPQYRVLPRPSRGHPHHYGPRVFVHAFPWPMSLLTRLCTPQTTQPEFNRVVASLYDFLLTQVVGLELTTRTVEAATRMAAFNPEAVLDVEVVDPTQDVVVVDIARAGILPGQRFYDGLHHVLEPAHVRQDHIFMNRAVNERGEVVGVNMSGSKIGGPVAGRTVIIPDPMGATGSSLLATMDLYRRQPGGPPARFIAVNLIVTPEYLRRLTAEAPDLHVHCVRVDRGMSPPAVFAHAPGLHEEEQGLNAHDYIVPGGGGFGELINNALS